MGELVEEIELELGEVPQEEDCFVAGVYESLDEEELVQLEWIW